MLSCTRNQVEHSAAKGNLELVSTLLKAGGTGVPGQRGCRGRTLLDAAAEGGSERVVMAILKAGAKPDIRVRSGSKRRSVRCGREFSCEKAPGVFDILLKNVVSGNEKLSASRMYVLYAGCSVFGHVTFLVNIILPTEFFFPMAVPYTPSASGSGVCKAVRHSRLSSAAVAPRRRVF